MEYVGIITRFVVKYNHNIVVFCIGMSLLLIGLWAYFALFKRGDDSKASTGSDLDISKIEESLKKILVQTQGQIQAVAPGAPGASAGGADSAALKAVQDELKTKVTLIEELQKKIEAAKASDNSPQLLAKIKNLEGKLAEYEIIEDDIADLSHYKEENAKLKKDLEGLKRGDASLVDQFAAVVSSTVNTTTRAPEGASAGAPSPTDFIPVETAAVDTPKGSLAAAVASAQANASNIIPPNSPSGEKIGDALDFTSQGKSKVVNTPPLTNEAAAAAVNPMMQTPASTPVANPASADIFGEFAGGQPEGGESDPLAALGDIDTSRMLEELKDLNADMNLGADTLDEAPDIDKMADEAEGLKKA